MYSYRSKSKLSYDACWKMCTVFKVCLETKKYICFVKLDLDFDLYPNFWI